MAFLSRLASNLLRSSSWSVTAPKMAKTPLPAIESLFGQSIRTKVRCYFPRPSERKRIKRHGYTKRMSTPSGRRIIMANILKGRFVLSH